ncbi:MAG: hypothetical protein NTY79_01755 [Chloroflexi bacterium]|nr:hypothetical protein [Chloroflexota bacterium]
MNKEQVQGSVLEGTRRSWVFVLVGAILVLAGSVFGADWMNYLYKTGSLYPAFAKPGIMLLALVIVLITGKYALGKRDWMLLLLAFLCMLPTDILMSVVVAVPGLTVGSWVFMIGGVLSIIAHIFLIIRVGRGFGYFKQFKLREAWLPILIYGSAVIVISILWNDVVRVGHAVLGPVYTAFFCTTTWLAWETVRRKLYPAPNAWMVAIAATCWYITEIAGEVYNLGMGNISQIMFPLVWVFYGTNVVLWALSGYRWIKD